MEKDLDDEKVWEQLVAAVGQMHRVEEVVEDKALDEQYGAKHMTVGPLNDGFGGEGSSIIVHLNYIPVWRPKGEDDHYTEGAGMWCIDVFDFKSIGTRKYIVGKKILGLLNHWFEIPRKRIEFIECEGI